MTGFIKSLVLLSLIMLGFMFSGCSEPYQEFEANQVTLISRPAVIDPDYSGIVIPPNISPLNFLVKEPGQTYQIKISSTNGQPIEIREDKGKIKIPHRQWKALLAQNKGERLVLDIEIQNQNSVWQRFQSITNRIASEEIDSHLAYRLLHPAYNLWNKVGIYQRNLENFDESPILINRITGRNCMNCHHFANNNPNQMILHIRGGASSGMVLNNKGKIYKVNTATDFSRAGAYPSWHPNGKLLALSVNKLSMFYHAHGKESRDVLDHASDLIVYQVNKNMITTSPQISDPKRMETFPCWSPDGQYLYFCSAPPFENFFVQEPDKMDLKYDQICYDLMRVPYNSENGTWGERETVLAAANAGKSITMPRISPDGRFVLFCMSDYSNFPIYLTSSDLYLLDLETGLHFKPDINSNSIDTFHSWSSNSRWFVFSSKRRDGLLARPHFAYVDVAGKVHKPFILPQEDPEFYDNFLNTYNVPELITGPVTVRPQKIIAEVLKPKNFLQAGLDPNVKIPDTDEGPEIEWRPSPQ